MTQGTGKYAALAREGIQNEPGGARAAEAKREHAARRDLFAAAALSGLLTDHDLMEAMDQEGMARSAWRYADAMLAAEPKDDR